MPSETSVPMHATEQPQLEPFLKWAGGKRWLCRKYPGIFPPSFGRYVEPFLGSGAVFFHLSPSRALLSDVNTALVETYIAMRRSPVNIHKLVKTHGVNHSAEHYYKIRAHIPSTAAEKAARFIYLNWACWNGLYRENQRGEFNVPKGTKENIVLAGDDFSRTARLLRQAVLLSGDFEPTLDRVTESDFVFIDPPYTVKHNANGFIKYNQAIFSWNDQRRLRAAVGRAAKRGARILVTNADHATVGQLYRGLGVKFTLAARRLRRCNAPRRQPGSFTNWPFRTGPATSTTQKPF